MMQLSLEDAMRIAQDERSFSKVMEDQSRDEKRCTGVSGRLRRLLTILQTGLKYDLFTLSELSGISILSIGQRCRELREYGYSVVCEKTPRGNVYHL